MGRGMSDGRGIGDGTCVELSSSHHTSNSTSSTHNSATYSATWELGSVEMEKELAQFMLPPRDWRLATAVQDSLTT